MISIFKLILCYFILFYQDVAIEQYCLFYSILSNWNIPFHNFIFIVIFIAFMIFHKWSESVFDFVLFNVLF